MIYCFILGKNPTLSLAEIISRFASLGWSYSILILTEQTAVFKLENEITAPQKLLNTLGGTQKLGRAIGEFEEFETERLADSLESWCLGSQINTLGFSCYNLPRSLIIKIANLARSLKKTLRHKGKFRYVSSPDFILSAATIISNGLLKEGRKELLFVGKPPFLGVFETIAVQDINAYTKRDIRKPYRDPRTGMLPPKLAQIMINLIPTNTPVSPEARRGGPPTTHNTIYDPFCGSGTILIEALLTGFKVIGSDNSPKQAEGAKKNLEWTAQEFKLLDPLYNIFLADATNPSKSLPENITAVVSELYLGPSNPPKNQKEMDKTIKELLDLYKKFLINFKKSGFQTFVLAFPVFKSKELIKLPLLDYFSDLGYNVKSPLPREIFEKYPKVLNNFDSKRQSIIYLLPDQRVGREIFLLEKN